MLFNSGVFLNFFAAFLLLYYMVRQHLTARNWLIVAASYLFYGWWDYRFLFLLIFSSLLDFGVGLAIERFDQPRKRKLILSLSIIVNLTFLGFFKYYDFFIDSFSQMMRELGVSVQPRTLHVILPVGISFYTFQSMSYAMEVYRRHIRATRNLVQFLAFVSFFPQLVAGPISRAPTLLPQFGESRVITSTMIAEGIWLCLWGLFKKVVIADNLEPLVEMVYGNSAASAPTVILATIAFGFQILCDFSGYSDIARGTAKILGFDIMINFRIPYAATNVREFWQRWHISLSTWLRDYLYISLGGNRHGLARTCANLFLTMLLGGLWHGAAWNFVLWGAWHGAGLVAHRLWSGRRPAKAAAPLGQMLSWMATMVFVFYGWLLFRAGSLNEIVTLTRALEDWSHPIWLGSYIVNLMVLLLPVIAVQVWQEKSQDLLAPFKVSRGARALLQGLLLVAIIFSWEKEKIALFIYFQF